MKKRTLFQTAIAIILDSRNAYVNRDILKKEYRQYLYGYFHGLTEQLESARQAMWNILIDAGALERAFQSR